MKRTREAILKEKRKAEGQKEIEEVFIEIVKKEKASADKK